MSRPRRLYFKRTHPDAHSFLGVCLTVAFSLLICIGVLVLGEHEGGTWGGWLLCLSPVALGALGFGGLAIHRGVLLESEPRTLTVYWGWSLPWGKAWPWRHVERRAPRVRASLEVRCLEPEMTSPTYTLVLPEGPEPLVLFSGLDYMDTRDKAERMARFLDLTLRDVSRTVAGGGEDEAQASASGTAPRTASLREGETRVVQLPSARPSGQYLSLLVKLLLATGVMTGVSALVAWGGREEPSVWLALPLVLPSWVLLLLYEHSSSLGHVIRGSRDGLVVESRSTFGRRVRRFPRAHVRQVGAMDSIEHQDEDTTKKVSRLLLRGSNFAVTLGAHLPRAELQARARELRAALGLEEDTPAGPRRSLDVE